MTHVLFSPILKDYTMRCWLQMTTYRHTFPGNDYAQLQTFTQKGISETHGPLPITLLHVRLAH